jgi:hypothetical protein
MLALKRDLCSKLLYNVQTHCTRDSSNYTHCLIIKLFMLSRWSQKEDQVRRQSYFVKCNSSSRY